MKAIFLFCCSLAVSSTHAQELFVFTEPASNMPANSAALRSDNYLLHNAAGNYAYTSAPEVMLGISKKLMIHAEAFFGQEPVHFRFNGASLYTKYRFYSRDQVHAHFRMALFGKMAYSNTTDPKPAIELGRVNSGAELGVVATKLINRVAVSAGGSVLRRLSFGNKPGMAQGKAIGYNLSVGKLLLPVVYKDYDQVNLNLMTELLGQTDADSGAGFLDIAPAVQAIFKSRTRVDLGYRFPAVNSLYRTQDKGFLLRLEYNFFNVFK